MNKFNGIFSVIRPSNLQIPQAKFNSLVKILRLGCTTVSSFDLLGDSWVIQQGIPPLLNFLVRETAGEFYACVDSLKIVSLQRKNTNKLCKTQRY
jgi:hypothetical protein